jgi:lipopolysaccharide export LptBFGC system permease protein LptF
LSGIVHLAKSCRPPAQKVEIEQRLVLQAAVLSVYFLSAVLTGWLFRHFPIAVGAVPALSLFLVAVHGILAG